MSGPAERVVAHRVEYIAGLRRLADLLEQNDAMTLPYYGDSAALAVFVYDRAGVAAYAGVLAGSGEKIDPDAKEFGYELEGRLAGLRVLIHAALDVACEATVTGAQVVRRVDWRTPLGVVHAGYAHSDGLEAER